jgi:adenylate kinase family enzyme
MPAKVKVFVLGRPGSGKTTAVRRLMELVRERNWKPTRIKDYDILYKMFQADSKKKRFHPATHGGFDVIDFSVLDTALEKLEKKVKWHGRKIFLKDELIIIEFARNDYREALKHFSPGFLRNSFFFFVDADIDTCIQRICDRVACSTATEDNHYVSEHIIKHYYSKDNWKYMADNLKRDYGISEERIEAVYNMGSLQEFIHKVDLFANDILVSRTRIQVGVDQLRQFYRDMLKRFSYKRDVPLESKSEDTQTPVVVGELGN